MMLKKISRGIALVGIFIIPFIPLIVTNSLFFPFITGKNFTFRIIVEVILAAWIILAATDEKYRPRRSWIFYSFAAFTFIMAIADIFSINPVKSFWSNYERMEGWVTLAHLLAYFMVASAVLAKEKLWDAFFQTSLGVNTVVILYSILQISGFLVINQGGVRTDSTLGNAAYLAIYAVFNIFIAALFLTRSSDRLKVYKNGFLALGFNAGFFAFVFPLLQSAALNKEAAGLYIWTFLAWIFINLVFYFTTFFRQERLVYAGVILFNLVVLYYTATRGAILGFIAGGIITALTVAIFEKHNKRVKQISYITIGALIVVVVGFLAIKNTSFVKNNVVLNRFATISVTETTTLSRFKLWNMAFQGFKQKPILGWGQESFNYVFNSKYNPELYNQEQWFDRTHNVIFDWLIAGGILGLAAYLAFFGSIVYYIWKKRGDSPHEFSVIERGILTGLLVAYFIHNLFVFDNLTSYLAFLSIAAYVYFRTGVVYEANAEYAHVKNRVVAPVVIVALIVALYGVNMRPFLANRALIQALTAQAAADVTPKVDLFKKALSYNSLGNQEIREQLLSLTSQAVSASAQQQLAGKDQLVALATSEIKKQFKETPDDARPYVLASALFSQIGDVKSALDALMTAHKLSPKKQTIDFAIGSTYMMQNDLTSAYKWFKEAYELDTSYQDARIYYAASAIYLHKDAEADQVLASLSTSTIAASNDIMSAYYNSKQYGRLTALWQQRVSDNPNSAQNHVSLAAAYLLSNNRKGAIAELQRAIDIEPKFKAQGEAYIKDIKAGKNP